MIFSVGLVIALFAVTYTLLSPGEYAPSPAGLAAGTFREKLKARFTAGDRQKMYAILGKTPAEVMKVGLIVGGGTGLVVLLAGLKFIGIFAVVPALLFSLLGLFAADTAFRNEYRQWQASLYNGVSVFVNLMPSFLETGAIIPREAMSLTLPFLPEPFRSEMWKVVDYIVRTGKVKEAMDEFARRASHPVVDAICFRLSVVRDANAMVSPDVFADLNDQIQEMTEKAAARATAAKSGLLALVCVIGLLGAGLIFGYPGIKYLFSTMGGVFGS